MASDYQHPYKIYERNALWTAIEQAIEELEGNNDVQLTTERLLVTGFLCKAVHPFVKADALQQVDGS